MYPRIPKTAIHLGLVGTLLIGGAASALPLDPLPLLVATANAPTRPTTVFRDALVVTATTRPEKLAETPFAAEAIERRELLERLIARTVPEALREQPGVMVQKTGHGQGSPYFRGFTGFRTLFLIDGVRLNNSVFRDGPNQYWATVDTLALDRVEVVRGPSSALYGSDSVGGTLQALTAGPSFSGWHGGVYGRWASAEDSTVGHLDFEGTLGSSWGFRIGAATKSFGDLEGGSEVGEQAHTGYDQNAQDFKLVWQGDNRRFTLLGQRDETDDAWRTHSTIYGIGWEGLRHGSDLLRSYDQDRSLAYLRLDEDRPTRFYDRLVATASRHRQEEVFRRTRSNSRRDLDTFDVITNGLMVRADKTFQHGVLTWGLENSDDAVDSTRHLFDAAGRLTSIGIQGAIADDAAYRLSGGYGQFQAQLGASTRLLVGLRYTDAEAEADKVEDPITHQTLTLHDQWDAWTGHARLVQTFGSEHQGQWWTAVAQAFRAPNLSDLTRYDSARSGEIETPTLGLDPEQYLTWELGLRWSARRFQSEIVAFDNEIDGMIDRTPTGRILSGAREVTKYNSGNGYSRGFDLTLRGQATDRLSFFGTFSYLRTEISTYPTATSPLTRQPINKEMPPMGSVGVRYDFTHNGLFVEAVVKGAAKADRLSTGDLLDIERIPPGGTPGYTVGTVRTGFEWRQLALALALENVTDEDYRIHGSGVNEPGRNLVAMAHWRF